MSAGSFDAPMIARLAAARMDGADVEHDEVAGDVESALAAQLAVLRTLEQDGQRVSGWKVGLTSGAAYDLMGAGVRPFGYLLAERTLASGAALAGGAEMRLQLEPELCLEIVSELRGSDLSPDDCRAAVGRVRAAFEINRMRVRMPGRNNLFVADGLGNWGTVLGEGTQPRAGLAATRVEMFLDGEPIGASAPDLVMDDPMLSLSRLCAGLDRHGLRLLPGQHVITGAFFRCDIARPGIYTARFSNIGEVALAIDPSFHSDEAP